MVEQASNNVDQQEDAEFSIVSKLPPSILSVVALYLPSTGKLRLAQGSHYFNQVLQEHFKLMLVREASNELNIFNRMESKFVDKNVIESKNS